MFSVCPHLWGGGGVPRPGPDRGYPSQFQLGYPLSDLAGGTPAGGGEGIPPQAHPLSDWAGGYPCQGVPPVRPGQGYPTSGILSDLAGGYPTSDLAGGYATSELGGVPHLGYLPTPLRPGRGYPCWGYPTSGTPHCTWLGGTPARGTLLRVTDRVLDTLRSVCFLRSRRRTFLWNVFWEGNISEQIVILVCKKYPWWGAVHIIQVAAVTKQ